MGASRKMLGFPSERPFSSAVPSAQHSLHKSSGAETPFAAQPGVSTPEDVANFYFWCLLDSHHQSAWRDASVLVSSRLTEDRDWVLVLDGVWSQIRRIFPRMFPEAPRGGGAAWVGAGSARQLLSL